MPGQHLRGTEVTAEALVHLDRVGCDVAVVRRHGASARCRDSLMQDRCAPLLCVIEAGALSSPPEVHAQQLVPGMVDNRTRHLPPFVQATSDVPSWLLLFRISRSR